MNHPDFASAPHAHRNGFAPRPRNNLIDGPVVTHLFTLNANHLALHIYGRTTRIPVIDRSVGLNELVLRQTFHAAMYAADDASRNAAGEPERIAYCDYFLSHLDLITVADFYGGQRTASID